MSTKRVRMVRPAAAALAAASLLGLACAKQPVLYPNEHYAWVGEETAKRDVAACKDLARRTGVRSEEAARAAGDVAESAAVGGAAGAASGAVLDNVSAGRGAAAGAAGAGAAALVRSLFRTRDPDPAYRRFVERCLRERGYEPVGWR